LGAKEDKEPGEATKKKKRQFRKGKGSTLVPRGNRERGTANHEIGGKKIRGKTFCRTGCTKREKERVAPRVIPPAGIKKNKKKKGKEKGKNDWVGTAA